MQHFSLFRTAMRNTRRGLSNRLKTNLLCLATLFLLALMPTTGWAQTRVNVSSSQQFRAALEDPAVSVINITGNFNLDKGHIARNGNQTKEFSSAYIVRGTKTIDGSNHTISRGLYKNSTIFLAENANLTINDLNFDGQNQLNYAPLFLVNAYETIVNNDTTVNPVNAKLTMNNCTIENCLEQMADPSYFGPNQIPGITNNQIYVNPQNPSSANYLSGEWEYTWYFVYATGGAAIHFAPAKNASNNTDNTITLNGCTFNNNECRELDDKDSFTSGGAIVLASDKSNGGTFENCTFTGNKAGHRNGKGGAVYLDRLLRVEKTFLFKGKTEISGNRAHQGGGICQWGGNLVINTTDNTSSQTIKIDNNEATATASAALSNDTGGGGILAIGGTTTFLGTATNPIQIINNKATDGYGGGILVQNAKSSFTYCDIGSLDNGNYAAVRGGGIHLAIEQNALNASFINCNIDYNYTTNDDSEGGGVFNYGTLSNDNYANTFEDCNIRYNGEKGSYKTKNGGGVYLKGSTKLSNCTISNNKASGDGGGLYMEDNRAKLSNGCHVNDNTANQGGGIYYKKGSLEDLNYIYSNTALYGGGVFVNPVDNEVTLSNLSIGFSYDEDEGEIIPQKNTAQDGGGVYTYGENSKTIKLFSCNIRYNEATRNGGGVYVAEAASGTLTLQLTNATLSENEATTGNGGGIYNNQTVTIENASYVYFNKALEGRGGCIYNNGTCTLNNCQIYYSQALHGGGVYVTKGATTNLGNITFDTNTATGSGGGIFNEGTVNQTAGLSIVNNEAKQHGGGIYHIGNPLTLTNATFHNNKALEGKGGGVHHSGESLTLITATFTKNTATENNGGGIYTEKTCTLTNCTIGEAGNANQAKNGGGIYMKGEELTINGGSVSYNTVSNNGGGIYLEQKNTFVNNNCRIQNNVASNNGGGIYIQEGKGGAVAGLYRFSALTVIGPGNDTIGTLDIPSGEIIATGTGETLAEDVEIKYYPNGLGHPEQEIYANGTIAYTDVTVGEEAWSRYFDVGAYKVDGSPAWYTDGCKFILRFKCFSVDGVYLDRECDITEDEDEGVYYYWDLLEIPAATDALPTTLTLNGSTVGGAGKGNTAGNFGGGVYISTNAIMAVEGTVKVQGNTSTRTDHHEFSKGSTGAWDDDACLQTISVSKGDVISHSSGKIHVLGDIAGSSIGITEEEITEGTANAGTRREDEHGDYNRQFTIDYYKHHDDATVMALFFSNDKVLDVIPLHGVSSDNQYQTTTGQLEVTLGIQPYIAWYVAGIVDDGGLRWGNDSNSGRAPDVPCRTLTGPNGIFARGYNPNNEKHHVFVVRSISIKEEAEVRTTEIDGEQVVVIRYPYGDDIDETKFQDGSYKIPDDGVSSLEVRLHRYPGKHKLSNGQEDEGGGTTAGAVTGNNTNGPGANLGPIVQMNAPNKAILRHIEMDGLEEFNGVLNESHNPGEASFAPHSPVLAVEKYAIDADGTTLTSTPTGTITLKEECLVELNHNKDGVSNEGREKRPGGGVYNAGTLVIKGSEEYTSNVTEMSGPCIVEENLSASHGGGIYIKEGTVTLEGDGTSVRDNQVTHADNEANGGGVYINTDGTMQLDGTGENGVKIQRNKAKTHGGGVYKLGTLKAQGMVTITENEQATVTENVYIPVGSTNDQSILITGELACGSSIGVTKTKKWNGTVGYGTDGDHTYNNDDNFTQVRTIIAKNETADSGHALDAYHKNVFFDDKGYYSVWSFDYHKTTAANDYSIENDYFIETWRSFADGGNSHVTLNNNFVTHVKTAEGLAYLAKQVNTGADYIYKTIRQTATIDLDGHYWEPIGFEKNPVSCDKILWPFSGSYDGQGHLIRNAISILPAENMGVFGTVGTIDGTSLAPSSSTIQRTFVINHDFVGTNEKTTGLGGLVGSFYGQLINRCEAAGKLSHYKTGSTKNRARSVGTGGLVGVCVSSPIINSFTVSEISNVINSTGGILGNGSMVSIVNCYTKNTIHNDENITIGAILGQSESDVDILNCYVVSSNIDVLAGTGSVMCCYAPYDGTRPMYATTSDKQNGKEVGTDDNANNAYYSPTIGADQLGYMYADNILVDNNGDATSINPLDGFQLTGPLFESLNSFANIYNSMPVPSGTPKIDLDLWARPALAYYVEDGSKAVTIEKPINGDLPLLMMNNYGDDGSVGCGGFTALSTVTEPEVIGIEGGPEPHDAYLIGDGYVLQYSGPKRDYSTYDNDPSYNDSEIDGMIARSLPGPISNGPLDCHFVYGDVSKAPTRDISANRISIYEHAAITQAGTLGSFDMTHVSITFDNSRAETGEPLPVSTNGMNGLDAQGLKRDWHLLSTPLLEASTGFDYKKSDGTETNTNDLTYSNNPWAGGGSATTPGGTEFGWLGGGNNRYWMTGWTGSQNVTSGGYVSSAKLSDWTDGYFPSTFDASLHSFNQGCIEGTNEYNRYPYGMDFYSWYEPKYHYINFKRNGPNHWHSDEPHVHLDYTPEAATNNSGAFDTNVNETMLLTGKGYFASIAEKTLLQSSGQLGGNVTPPTPPTPTTKPTVYRVGVANWGMISAGEIEPKTNNGSRKDIQRSDEVVYYQNSIFDDLDEKQANGYLDLTYLHNLKDSNSNDLSGLYIVDYVDYYVENEQVKIVMDEGFWGYYNENDYFYYDESSLPQELTFDSGIESGPVAKFVMRLFPNNGFQPGGNYLEYVPSYSFTSGNKEIDLYQIFDNNSPITVTHTTDDNQEITGNLYAGKITGWNCHGWEQDSYLDEYNSYPLHLFVVDDQTSESKSEAESRAYTPVTKEIYVTHTEDAKLCNGWNLVGNPFHAYLDFNALCTDNSGKITDDTYIVYNADGFGLTDEETGVSGHYGDGFSYYVAGGSENGAYAHRYLHPHQGFFVKTASSTTLNFSESQTQVRKQIGTGGSYRDDSRPAYPLVNLFLTSDKGCSDVTVVELNRPEWGGATKMREMYAGNGMFYASHDGTDYAALFATDEVERIPLHFEPKDRDGDTYTISWNTQNGDFHKLFLIDNLTGVTYDMLRNSSYSFAGKKGDYDTRFYITFDVTGVEENDDDDTPNATFAFFDGNAWVVTNAGNGPASLDLFDLQGRLLHSTTLAEGQARIGLPDVAKGMYLLRLCNNKGTQVQKVIVK